MKLASQTKGRHGFRHLLRRQQPGIRLLPHDHPWIAPQLPGQLAVAYVDRIDAGRAMGEQDVGEAARRRADIGADAVRDREAEMRKAVRQLQAAARYPGMILPL